MGEEQLVELADHVAREVTPPDAAAVPVKERGARRGDVEVKGDGAFDLFGQGAQGPSRAHAEESALCLVGADGGKVAR